MPKIRVHELAKEFDISSKELLNFLDKLEIKDKKAASNLSDDELGVVRNSFRNVTSNNKKTTVEQTVRRSAPNQVKAAPREIEKPVVRVERESTENAPVEPVKKQENTASEVQRQDMNRQRQGGRPQEQRPRQGYQGNQNQRKPGEYTRPQSAQDQQGQSQQRPARPQQPQGEATTDGDSRRKPYGERPTGERPTVERSTGERQGSTRPTGQGQYQSNDSRTGERKYQDNRNQGQRPQNRRPQDGRPQENRPHENRPQDGREQRGQWQGQGQKPQGQYVRRDGTQAQGQRPPREGQTSGYQGSRDARPQGQGVRREGTPGTGQRPPYQGQKPPYQGQRPANQGFKKDSPQGDRGPRQFSGQGTAKPAAKPATGVVAQKPATTKRFDKAKDINKKQNKQASMYEETSIQKPGPKTKKLSKKEIKKIQQAERDLETARKLEEQAALGIKVISLGKNITVKDLAEKMGKPTSDIIKPLMKIGIMATINQEIDYYTASNIASSFDILVEEADEVDILEEAFSGDEEAGDMIERPPVVVVMGHVDHGKTSLLDSIRKARVTDTEAGGITQHIGAYTVEINNKPITFLDTPGHEAFTAMRMRGAQITDIAILVVAADDGVMPQTIEAINHAKAANVDIIVAINKIDKPSANPDRVKQELTEFGILTEDWGGETICVPVSALKKTGIDHLLEMILLVAEIRELKADPHKRAKGTVIESQLDKGKGPVATMLVQEGTLKIGDPIVAGGAYGRIRAMMDDKGEKVKKAGPSMPVEILGLNEVPMAGDVFYIADNERQARQVAESVVAQGREDMIKTTQHKISLDDLFIQIQSGNVKDLNIVIKADVAGSVEAVKNSLERLSNEQVRIRTIHGGVGAITESDVMLASASNAIIIGFNVRPENAAAAVASEEKVDVRLYRIIYNAIEDITAAMKGMLDPVFKEKVIGHAEIRQIFKASGIGNIAGSYVTDGKITRNSKVRVVRDGVVAYEGELAALRRFKDDVREVATGYECGLTFTNYNDIKEGDRIEAFIMEEIER